MRNTILTASLLGAATVLATEGGSQDLASCQAKLQAAGMMGGMGDQMVMTVQVANKDGAFKYFPDSIQAPVGSIVQFQFNPKNHTVTESSFAEPCKPLAANLTSPTRPGQRSGFVPVTAQDTDIKVFNVLVNDTKPIWIYCGQAAHCQMGMSMVINQNMADPEKTIQKYQEKAALVPPPAGMTIPPPAPTPVPAPGTPGADGSSNGAGGIPGGDASAAALSSSMMSMSMSMSASMTTSMTMSTTIAASGAASSSPVPNNSTAVTRPGGTGTVTSGAAQGTPAVLNSFASTMNGSFRQAGLIGLFIAFGAMLL